MEKILLGIAAVLAEMLRRELPQLPCRHPAPAWKIFPQQDTLNPDVDRESV